MANNCSSCGGCRGNNRCGSSCSSCSSGCAAPYSWNNCSRNCGALRYLGCDSCSRVNNCRDCGCRPYESVFYNGPCPVGCGCNSCSNCNNCNSCNHCHDCGCRRGAAAGFVALSPQSCCAGGAFNFTADRVGCDAFALCEGGVRILKSGTYAAMYSFSAPAGYNGAAVLSLSCGGSEVYSSRSSIEPAVCAQTRSASGHALVYANAGDVLSLNSSCAMDIPDPAYGGPVATLMIYSVD